MNKIIPTLIIMLCCLSAGAQNFFIDGTVIDYSTRKGVSGSQITLLKDSSKLRSFTTIKGGKFLFDTLNAGEYLVNIKTSGYNFYSIPVTISNSSFSLDTIFIEDTINLIAGATITIIRSPVTIKGDTTEFNATSFKVNTDATAEDLITKMPGITMEGGKVKSNGEEIKKVTVDGKEFFGDDASIALKNLPAEIIDKIQVYDRSSDQAEFTGFKDGETTKTVNIKTKGGKNNGTFGKFSAGYGTDDRYLLGGNVNFFKNDRRISILGLSNNINQQNFATQDLPGATTSTSGGGRGRNSSGASSSFGNSFSGQSNGINTNNSIGLNYS
ncbi:MAG: TonB-dependent receptor, partial [Bacteroidia bacterium]|nr:TonB-dependent receptor [Bacteroidia bacterium]